MGWPKLRIGTCTWKVGLPNCRARSNSFCAIGSGWSSGQPLPATRCPWVSTTTRYCTPFWLRLSFNTDCTVA